MEVIKRVFTKVMRCNKGELIQTKLPFIIKAPKACQYEIEETIVIKEKIFNQKNLNFREQHLREMNRKKVK